MTRCTYCEFGREVDDRPEGGKQYVIIKYPRAKRLPFVHDFYSLRAMAHLLGIIHFHVT
jgi:hypothetical protein